MTSAPQVSILVTIVDGGETLRACLESLRGQRDAPPFEVLVPWDASLPGMEGVAESFPEVDFLPLGPLGTERPLETPAGQHELFDRRRSAGLAAAGGEIVCILEDRGVPDPDWLATMVELQEPEFAAVGGAVECGVDKALNWAVYFCDFSRYQLPFEPGPRDYVTDVNISYTRHALESTRHLWEERYHETTVNWALTRDGGLLLLSPDPVVRQVRRDLRMGSMLRERLEWGRLFAYTRAREAGGLRRAFFAALAPALPLLLLLRHGAIQFKKRRHFARFVAVSPIVALLLTAWSLGELRGYLTGRP